MSRPMGPKRLAAIAERDKMKAAGKSSAEIRDALIASGLTKQQANEVCPVDESDMKPAPMRPVTMNDEVRAANIQGAIHFLETIAKRLTPNVCDRFTELGPLKGDALTWARKLKGIL